MDTNKDIINFLDFLKKENVTIPTFNKEEYIEDFPTEEEFNQEKLQMLDEISEKVDVIKNEVTKILEEVEIEVEDIQQDDAEIESDSDFYTLYRDKNENFSCDINVEGAKISETSARLIIETEEWSLIFEGEIDKHGKCTIPIKKLNIFNENTKGIVKLEVNAESNVFIPWESECKIKNSKQVTVKMNETKSQPKKPIKTGVSVNVKR